MRGYCKECTRLQRAYQYLSKKRISIAQKMMKSMSEGNLGSFEQHGKDLDEMTSAGRAILSAISTHDVSHLQSGIACDAAIPHFLSSMDLSVEHARPRSFLE